MSEMIRAGLGNPKQIATSMSNYFLLYTAAFPIVDVLNGWLLDNNNHFPLGIIYRLGLVFFCLLLLSKKKYLIYRSIFSLLIINTVSLGCLLFIQALYFANSLSNLTADLSSLMKYILLILVCLVFSECSLKPLQNLRFLLGIDVLLILGLLIPYLLGVGNHTYGNSSAGFKGFYFATNDITYAFTIIVTQIVFSLQKQYEKRITRYVGVHWLLISLNLFCLFLISTKFGLIYIIFILAYLMISLVLFNEEVRAYTKFLLVYFGLISSLFMAFAGYKYVFKMLENLIGRLQYFYHYYDGNILSVITSSRSIYLTNALEDFLRYPQNYLVLWFGYGFSKRVELFGRAGNIEMDFIDSLFSFGVLGFLLTIWTFVKLFKLTNKSPKNGFILFISLIYAMFSGHILYSGMSTVILGIVVGQMINERWELDA